MAELDNKTRLEKINLDPKVIENTLANANVTANVIATLKEAEVTECDKKLGKKTSKKEVFDFLLTPQPGLLTMQIYQFLKEIAWT